MRIFHITRGFGEVHLSLFLGVVGLCVKHLFKKGVVRDLFL